MTSDPQDPGSADAASPPPAPDPNADPTPPHRPRATGPIQYRGGDLEPERGPGLGCFRFQLVVLAIFVGLAPLSVSWGWPPALSAALLFVVIVLLLVAGQTIIFLLRLVAADRRGRRRPLASGTPTVGELEDAEPTAEPPGPTAEAAEAAEPAEPIEPATPTAGPAADGSSTRGPSEPEGPVRQ